MGRSYVYDLSTKLPCVKFFTKVVAQSVQFRSESPFDHSIVEEDQVEDIEGLELTENS